MTLHIYVLLTSSYLLDFMPLVAGAQLVVCTHCRLASHQFDFVVMTLEGSFSSVTSNLLVSGFLLSCVINVYAYLQCFGRQVLLRSFLGFMYPTSILSLVHSSIFVAATITSPIRFSLCVSVIVPISILPFVGVYDDKGMSFGSYPRKLICNVASLGILRNLKVPSVVLAVPFVVPGSAMAAPTRGVASALSSCSARMVPVMVTVVGSSAMDGVGTNGATIKINPNINVNACFI